MVGDSAAALTVGAQLVYRAIIATVFKDIHSEIALNVRISDPIPAGYNQYGYYSYPISSARKPARKPARKTAYKSALNSQINRME
jgi:hypothetical protein